MAKVARGNLAAMLAQRPGVEPPAPLQRPSKADDRKGQTLRLSPEAWLQLKQTALDRRVTAHAILTEALNDWFRKEGLPPIA